MPAISHYMTKQPFTISPKASLAEAHQMMRDHNIRHLPVVDDGELVGIVSKGDLHLLETLAEFPLEAVEVEEAMTPNPFYVTADEPIDDVVEIMAEHKYGSAIILGRGGIEGIFTYVDACHALVDLIRRSAAMELEVEAPEVQHTGYSR
jgi:acetoin utilization protein AcuB